MLSYNVVICTVRQNETLNKILKQKEKEKKREEETVSGKPALRQGLNTDGEGAEK